MMLFLKKQWLKRVNPFKKQALVLFLVVLQILPFPVWAFSAYSTKELEALEKEFIQLINQSHALDRNPLVIQYINHLGKRLNASSGLPAPYFFIVKSSEINAFAGPGGYIGINTQLILATENESELAAVMAHEISHVRLHHLYYMLEHQKQMRIPMLASMLAAVALGAINPTLGTGALMASLTGFAQDNINFVRSNEKEADRIGINMLSKAGFNPWGMPGFFKKMEENMRYYYTDNIPAILRTHPLDEDRIAEAENRITLSKNKVFTDSVDYALFKELIRNHVSQDQLKLLNFYQYECKKKQAVRACQFGQALALIEANDFKKAQALLDDLVQNAPDNIYFQFAMAQSETGLKQHKNALDRLEKAYENYPDNYATLMIYAQAMLEAGQYDKASRLLLKGSRQYKWDLPLCKSLARAQANAGQTAYAYFTQSQCMLIQGRHRDAINFLKVAKSSAKKDEYMLARIEAMIDEIKYLASN